MTEKFVKVRIYEPTFTEVKLTKTRLSKWDLVKIILFGTIGDKHIYYKGETYIPYKIDQESAINVANVKEEE